MRNTIMLLFLIASTALAALPPQSAADLKANADYIFQGEILSVTSELKPVSNGTNRHYVITVRIDQWQKGKITVENPVRVHCRTIERRPSGWAGPQGQNDIPEAGTKAKFYVRKGFKLLEPNGWVQIP